MNNKKLAIISISFFLVSIIVLGLTIYFVFLKPPADAEGKTKQVDTYKYDLGNFSTNIGTSGRYFKGNIVVESTDKKTPEIIEKNVEPIRDYILKLIISQDVKSMVSESGIDNLKLNIKKPISHITGTDDISTVYFTEYIIQ